MIKHKNILATWLTEMHLSKINQFAAMNQTEDETQVYIIFISFCLYIIS